MKLCPKCGVAQNDDRTICVDCGAMLGEPVPEAAAEKITKAESAKISGMASRADDFHVGAFNIVTAAVNAAAAVLNFFLCLKTDLDATLFALIFCSAIAIVFALFPKLEWMLFKLRVIFYADADSITPSSSYIVFYRISLTVITAAICFVSMYILLVK